MNSEQDQPGTHGTLVSHLLELRTRLLRCAIVVLVIFLGLYAFSSRLYTLLAAPLLAHLPHGGTLIATGIAAPFLAPLKLTLALSVLLALPFLLHQLWSFVSPGLYRCERVLAAPLLASSVILFYTGVAFAYWVVFPLVFRFFTRVAPVGVTVTPDITSYLDFTLKLFFAFGLAFEVPIAILLAIWSGITTVEALSGKRPYIIVLAFIVGMLLTPPDIISQTLLAIPLWLLFELGLIGARFLPRFTTSDLDKPRTL